MRFLPLQVFEVKLPLTISRMEHQQRGKHLRSKTISLVGTGFNHIVVLICYKTVYVKQIS